MAVLQGGIPVPGDFTVIGPVREDYILFFTIDEPLSRGEPLHVITFREGQGSEILGTEFFRHWGHDVEWDYSWGSITDDESFEIPKDAQAVFVVVALSTVADRAGHEIVDLLIVTFRVGTPNDFYLADDCSTRTLGRRVLRVTVSSFAPRYAEDT